jgi:hypothetical protein
MLPQAPSGFSNYKRSKKLLVGAVGIENNDGLDFKDLRGMRRNTKSLKRNDGEPKGILIAPLMLPHFSRAFNPFCCYVSPTTRSRESASGSNLAARMASRL